MSSGVLIRTSSQICGVWYLPMFLLRDRQLIHKYIDSSMVLASSGPPDYAEDINSCGVTYAVTLVIHGAHTLHSNHEQSCVAHICHSGHCKCHIWHKICQHHYSVTEYLPHMKTVANNINRGHNICHCNCVHKKSWDISTPIHLRCLAWILLILFDSM